MTTPEALTALADRVEREELNAASDIDMAVHVAVGRSRLTFFRSGTNYVSSLDAAATLVPNPDKAKVRTP